MFPRAYFCAATVGTVNLPEWAAKWNIPTEAFQELCTLSLCLSPERREARLESQVQAEGRMNAARAGALLWRNNRGAVTDPRSGNFIRYGLANDSRKLGDAFKSGDCIGIEPVIITAAHVGKTIGRFRSIEFKHAQWKFSGDKEEIAQVAWATLVNSRGGRATITNDPTQV